MLGEFEKQTSHIFDTFYDGLNENYIKWESFPPGQCVTQV